MLAFGTGIRITTCQQSQLHVKHKSGASEAGEGVCDRGVDGPYVSAEATGEKEKGDLEHHWKVLDEEV